MKKWTRINLWLTAATVAVLGFTATKSPQTAQTMLMIPHPDTCWKYLVIVGDIYQKGCDESCPPNCTEIHLDYWIKTEAVHTCPAPQLFNREHLMCEDPWLVDCPHTPRCVNTSKPENSK